MPTELYNDRVRELFGMHTGVRGGDGSRLLQRVADGVEDLEMDTEEFHFESLRLQIEQHKLLKKIERGVRDLNRNAGLGNAGQFVDLLGDMLDRRSRRAGGPGRGARGSNPPRASAPGTAPRSPQQPRNARGQYQPWGYDGRGPAPTRRVNGMGITHPRVSTAANAGRAVAETATSSVGNVYQSVSQSIARSANTLINVPRNVMAQGRTLANTLQSSVSNAALRVANNVTSAIGSGVSAVQGGAGSLLTGAGALARGATRFLGPLAAGFAANDYVAGARAPDVLDKTVGARNTAGLASAISGFTNWGFGSPLDALSQMISGRTFSDNATRGWERYEDWAHGSLDSIRSWFSNPMESIIPIGVPEGPDTAGNSTNPFAKTAPNIADQQLTRLLEPQTGASTPRDTRVRVTDKTNQTHNNQTYITETNAVAPLEFPMDRWGTGENGPMGPRVEQSNDRRSISDWMQRLSATRVVNPTTNMTYDRDGLRIRGLDPAITTLNTTAVRMQRSVAEQTNAVVSATQSLEETVRRSDDTFEKLNRAVRGGPNGAAAVGAFGGAVAASTGPNYDPTRTGQGGGNGRGAGAQVTEAPVNDPNGVVAQRAAANRQTQRLLSGDINAPITGRAFTGRAGEGVDAGGYSSFGNGSAGTNYTALDRDAVSRGGVRGAHGGRQRPASDGSTHAAQRLGLTQSEYYEMREGIATIEDARYDQMGGAGGRYAGRYQFGTPAIADAAKLLGETAPTTEAFLRDGAMQDRYFDALAASNHDTLMRTSPQYAAMSPRERAGVIGYAHNQGAGGAAQWLRTGVSGRDAFGTDGTKYVNGVRARFETAGAGTGVSPTALAGASMMDTGRFVPFQTPRLGTTGSDMLASIGEGRGRANLFSGRGSQLAQTFDPNRDLTTITSGNGEQWTVHRDAAYAFEGLVNELESMGYPVYSSGAYNDRNKRGSGSKSEHAYGTALDLNSRENPMGRNLVTDLPADISDIAARWGLSWGGDWKSVKDAMHFEWRGISQADLIAAQANPDGPEAKRVRTQLISAAEEDRTGGRGGGLAGITSGQGSGTRRDRPESPVPSFDSLSDNGRGRVRPAATFDERWGPDVRPTPPSAPEGPTSTTPTPATRPTPPAAPVPVATTPPPVRQSGVQMSDIPDIAELKMLMATSNMVS